jgi:hypothetical protein
MFGTIRVLPGGPTSWDAIGLLFDRVLETVLHELAKSVSTRVPTTAADVTMDFVFIGMVFFALK